MEKIFKLQENGTTVRTEIVAGITTFLTMAYIIALNPNILTGYGFAAGDQGQMLWNAVFVATCLASGIAMICMAFIANKPFCLAPGMGLNSFFAATVATLMVTAGVSYVAGFQAMLLVVIAEGIVFLILTLCNVREKIVEAIPRGVRFGIAPAIGLMLLSIGFGSNVYIPDATGEGQVYMLQTFFGALTALQLKESLGPEVLGALIFNVSIAMIGLLFILYFIKKKVRGAVIIGMLVASLLYWAAEFAMGQDPFAGLATASWIPPFADMAALTLFQFNFETVAQIGWVTVLTLIITFCMIDMFDTIGTLVGTASRAGMVDEEGNMPQMKEALLADAIGTCVGGLTGTSTVTTFVESASGVEAGGRTGLTSLTCGILFLACLFLSPIAQLIPAAATSSALIYVGIVMLQGLKNINWDDLNECVPVAVMLIAMPITSSIGNAIGMGLILYTLMKIFDGKPKEVSALTYVIAILFLVKFFFPGM